MSPPEHPSENADRLRLLVAAIGVSCAMLGCIVLIGWHMHLPALIQLREGMAPMQYNTAICFILAGLAMYVRASGRVPLAVPVCGGLIAIVGSLTLLEYLFHADLGIDQALFHSYIISETSQIGRMSPVSALCFALAGLSFVCLSLRCAGRWRAPVAGSAASIIISISLAAVSGYAFGLPGTYGWGQLTRVAMHTAAGLGFVGAGLFIMAWNLAIRSGERTPRWLPVPLALGIFTGSLVLCFALEGKQNEEIAQTVKAGAKSAKNQIALRLSTRTHSIERMAESWEFSGAPSQAAWEADAANYVRDFPDMQALEWIDATHHVRWIAPLAGNEGKLNLDLTVEDRRQAAIAEAEREHGPVITNIVTLFRGGLGFLIYMPIVVNGQKAGFIAAAFNAQSSFRRYLPPAVAADEAIQLFEQGHLFFERDASAPSIRQDWIVPEKIELRGTTWNLRMWPTPALASRLDSPLPAVVLLAGVLCSLLLAAVCFFSQRSSRQATEAALANSALQAALDKVRTLEGLLPICTSCKRVRDVSGHWNQIDTYIHEHTNASLSHGYCPECAAKAFTEFGFDVPAEVQAAVQAGHFEAAREAGWNRPLQKAVSS